MGSCFATHRTVSKHFGESVNELNMSRNTEMIALPAKLLWSPRY